MTQTSNLTIQPQQILVKDIAWGMDEITELKAIYSGRPFIELTKRDIRDSVLLQKAMKCEVVMNMSLQHGDTAILHLAQVGYDLVALV